MNLLHEILTQLTTDRDNHGQGMTNTSLGVALKRDPNRIAEYTKRLYRRGLISRSLVNTVGKRGAAHYVYTLAPDPAAATPAPVNGFHHVDTPAPDPKPAVAASTAPSEDPAARFARVFDQLSAPIQELANLIAEQTMAKVSVALTERMTELTIEITKDLKKMDGAPTPTELANRMSEAVGPDKHRRKSVLIMGLLPMQAGQIQDKFGDAFDLRFWKSENPSLLKANAKTADYIISFTSKLGHSAENIIKSVNKPITRVPGGMTSLENKLTELYCQ